MPLAAAGNGGRDGVERGASGAGPSLAADRPGRAALGLGAALAAVGLLSRLAPLLDGGGRLFREFPTEDGYLMLTIARNIAIGKGMSVSDGLQATNGTQPLATFLWAGAFWIAGAERAPGVLLVLLLQVLFSCIAAYLLFELGRRLLGGSPHGAGMALIVAAAWFASPLTVGHSMNCLETGLYAVIALCVAIQFAGSSRPEPWSAGRCLGVGALLGLAFWVRNDAVFLVLSACALHVGWALWYRDRSLRRRLLEALVFGAVCAAAASPWLLFNQLRFGSIVPVSGQSEALDVRLGENLWRIPWSVFEYATLYVPLPRRLEDQPAVLALCSAVCAAVAALVAVVLRRAAPAARAVTAGVALYALCLFGFYGGAFGAGWFFRRYTFPLSPFIALLVGVALRRAWQLAEPLSRPRPSGAAAAALLALALGWNARLYAKGASHPHFPMTEWVTGHVPASAWVAALQTGTLGFFHERTINLDGKVNPAALRARGSPGGLPRYIVAQDIEYIVDWEVVAGWARDPVLAPHFELLVHDPAGDLVVLRRTDRAGVGAESGSSKERDSRGP